MGLLFGIAIWIKYTAAVAFATLVVAWLRQGRASVGGGAGLAMLYATACALPTALTAAAYGAAGQFGAFWSGNFGSMGIYIAMPPRDMVRNLKEGLLYIWPLLLLGASGIWFGSREREAVPRAAAAMLTIWLAAEALAVAAPLKFWSQYFLILLPPLSFLSSLALSIVAGRTVLPHLRPAAPCVLAGAVALVPLASTFNNTLSLLLNPDVPRQVAAVIRGDPGATAWVVNSQPIIYFLAGIEAPTRFPFPPHLVGNQSAMTGTDPVAEVDRILAGHPRFLVVDEARWADLTPQTAAPVRAALTRDYVKVASFPAWRGSPPNVGVFRLSSAASPRPAGLR